MQAAAAAMEQLGLTKLIMVPAWQSPGKTGRPEGASARQRLEMLRIAASADSRIRVSDLELRREDSYTYTTLCALAEQDPQAEYVLLMGSDMLASFPAWKNADKIARKAGIAVFSRGDKGEKQTIAAGLKTLKALGARAQVVESTPVQISSTQLRRLLAFQSGEDFLPAGVSEYIRGHGLYDTAACWKQLPMEQLEPIVIRLLDAKRVSHVLGCRDTAVKLAERWGADRTDAARAGILHDITKALDGPLQLTLCASYGKILDDFSSRYPKTLHALTGSLVAERIFGENPAVVSAICSHTTGKADMDLLEKIIYVADYMEPNRDFPGVEKLRELAFTDINAALKLGLEMTLDHLKEQGSEVSPESRSALLWLNQTERDG